MCWCYVVVVVYQSIYGWMAAKTGLRQTFQRNTNFKSGSRPSFQNSYQDDECKTKHKSGPFKFVYLVASSELILWFYLFCWLLLSKLKLTKYWPLSLNKIWMGDILSIISGCLDIVIIDVTGLLNDVMSVKSGKDCIWLFPEFWLVRGCKLVLWLVIGWKLWLWLRILMSPKKQKFSKNASNISFHLQRLTF